MTQSQRTSTLFKTHPVAMTFLVGGCIGLLAPVIYLTSGGNTFLSVPTWAIVVFYPGFYAGYTLYDALGYSGAVITGVVALVLSYGLISLGIGRLIRLSRKQST